MEKKLRFVLQRMKGLSIVIGFMLAMVALCGFVGINHAFALEFETSIRNNSGATVAVQVYSKGATGSASQYADFSLFNQDSRTVTFLGLTGICLSYLKGTVGGSTIPQMTCNGNESASTSDRCCGNYTFEIYKRNDNTYHFRKIQ